MSVLSQIHSLIGPELERLNATISSELHSGNAVVDGIVERYLSVKGKQLRPMLTLLSARLFGGVNDSAVFAAASVEMLHNASLIHDDVIDRATQRRGAPTINSVWDNHVAVLVGDFFVSAALTCAVKSGKQEILSVLSQLGKDLSLGEIDQINVARSHEIDEATYMDIISKKTASLFTTCVETGGVAAGATQSQLEGIKEWARLLGLCFQIKDDTFDYFHDPVVGKPTGNDLREGKITLPLIYAFAQTDRKEHTEMKAITQKGMLSDSDIERLVQWAKDCGGIDYANQVMRNLMTRAEQHLRQYPQGETITALTNIFEFIITREK